MSTISTKEADQISITKRLEAERARIAQLELERVRVPSPSVPQEVNVGKSHAGKSYARWKLGTAFMGAFGVGLLGWGISELGLSEEEPLKRCGHKKGESILVEKLTQKGEFKRNWEKTSPHSLIAQLNYLKSLILCKASLIYQSQKGGEE